MSTQRRPQSARDEFYETTRPAWRWYMFVFKAKMIYAAVIIAICFVIVAYNVLFAPPSYNPAREYQDRVNADRTRTVRRLAGIEGSPTRLPMRSDLTSYARKRCKSVWLTSSGRTTQADDGSLQGFPNEINDHTPHPPECYE